MVNLIIARQKDAKELLELQKKCFSVYEDKYGDFGSNPYHMTLHRMEFNIKYQFGYYYKIVDFSSNKIVGGIFIFQLDDPKIMKIAQFYLDDEFKHKGIGTMILNAIFEKHQDVNKWYVDTIYEEEYNVAFYRHLGFKEIDKEIEHEGLTFVTLLKK